MTQVKSPYNFVPLNKKVFLPYWSKYVSHDIPFKDALSGKIKLKITAKTPIFIRGKEEPNSNTPKIGNTPIYQYRFFKHKGKYCIPGTSIKGELESILENLSFAKLNRLNDSKYSIRDWDNKNIYNKADFANALGGFLIKEER